MIDWPRFLGSIGVPFVTKGRNVARGHIGIKCPFCGDADPSEHMGIRLTDGAWGCFRNPEHRGRSPIYLVARLRHCSMDEARELVESNTYAEDISIADLRKRMERLDADLDAPQRKTLDFPDSFRKFVETATFADKRIHTYLRRRGFPNVLEVASFYGLRLATSGSWRSRVIFPLVIDGELRGWTGRAIVKATARYKTFPEDESVRELVWNHDGAKEGGRLLLVTEGPFDGMKIDWYGRSCGVRAIGNLGVSCNPAKAALICDLADRYDQVGVMLDAQANARAIDLQNALALSHARWIGIPAEVEDPGALSPADARRLTRRLVR